MSYIKVHVPEIYQLKEQFESDKDKWIQYYSKYGGYVGSTESMDYLNKKLKEHYDNK